MSPTKGEHNETSRDAVQASSSIGHKSKSYEEKIDSQGEVPRVSGADIEDNGDNVSDSSQSEIGIDFIRNIVFEYRCQIGIISSDTNSSSENEDVELSSSTRKNQSDGKTRNTNKTYKKSKSEESLDSSARSDSADDERKEDKDNNGTSYFFSDVSVEQESQYALPSSAPTNQKQQSSFLLSQRRLHERDQQQQKMLNGNERKDICKRKHQGNSALKAEKRQKKKTSRSLSSRQESQEELSSSVSGMSESINCEGSHSSYFFGNRSSTAGSSLSESYHSSPTHTDISDISSGDSMLTQNQFVHIVTDDSLHTSSGSKEQSPK